METQDLMNEMLAFADELEDKQASFEVDYDNHRIYYCHGVMSIHATHKYKEWGMFDADSEIVFSNTQVGLWKNWETVYAWFEKNKEAVKQLIKDNIAKQNK